MYETIINLPVCQTINPTAEIDVIAAVGCFNQGIPNKGDGSVRLTSLH